MQLINQLDVLLGQVSKIRILRFLVTTVTATELNGSEIAAAVGLSHVKCHIALKELNQHGVVIMRRSGRSILYRLNLKSVLVKKMLLPLFENEQRLKNVLKEIIIRNLKGRRPKGVILFGSFALGKNRPDSDIDLLVVCERDEDIPFLRDDLEKAEAEVTIGFGNRLAPLFMNKEDFRKRFKGSEKLIRIIAKEGKVLFGDSINELITTDD